MVFPQEENLKGFLTLYISPNPNGPRMPQRLYKKKGSPLRGHKLKKKGFPGPGTNKIKGLLKGKKFKTERS